jgi:hypothetical protein
LKNQGVIFDSIKKNNQLSSIQSNPASSQLNLTQKKQRDLSLIVNQKYSSLSPIPQGDDDPLKTQSVNEFGQSKK